jgi:XTP/dITP diphosphohydrolase
LASDAPLLLATRSSGKLRELNGILASAGFRAVNLSEAGLEERPGEEGIECYETFERNALAKAKYFNARTGMPTLADDSGLCVDALGGAPGVWSKRFSGEKALSGHDLDDANNARLLDELAHAIDLRAGYKCAAAFVGNGVLAVETGEVRGRIVREPRGSGGFGYDPYFFADELGSTFGEASIDAKGKISHRGRAFRELFERHADAIRNSIKTS